jgi:nucleoside-diphosphate-sugar epimerase
MSIPDSIEQERPRPPWIPARVFISGASGFVGRSLAARYRQLGSEVRGVDKVADRKEGVVAGDTAQPGAWQDHAQGSDLFIHAAAIVSFTHDPRNIWEVNVLGTRHALDAAIRGGAQRFLHISSVVAYSFDFPADVTETYPVRSNGVPYVDAKVMGEQVVLQAHAAGEIGSTIIRPGDVYGPRSRPWTTRPVKLIKAGTLVLPLQGRGIFTPIYIDNLVDGIVLAAGTKEAAGQVFNLTDGKGIENRNFFGYYARLLGKEIPIVQDNRTQTLALRAKVEDRIKKRLGIESQWNETGVRYLCRRGTYSIEKARKLLGFEPRVGIDEGMKITEQWLREERFVV